MTKKTLQLLASAALVAGLGFTTIQANASATTNTGSQDTTAKVTLSSKGAGDNGNNGNGDGDGGNVAGSLAITSAPDVTFSDGKGNVLDGKTALDLTGTFAKGANSWKDAELGAVTVVDPGTASGWKVQVSNTALTNDLNTDADKTNDVAGAAATIQGGNINFTGAKVASTDSTNPAGATADADNISLATAGTQNKPVYNAKLGAGVGTWTDTFSGADLTVPSGNAAGSYTSTLTWTLTNTPE